MVRRKPGWTYGMTSKWRTITSSIFSNEVVAYCISDVMLLKSGCHKFQQELQQHGEFNPMEKCVTIASTCDRYWLEKHLPKDTMAVEPPQRCYGSRSDQSLKALLWLSWCGHQPRQSTRSPTSGTVVCIVFLRQPAPCSWTATMPSPVPCASSHGRPRC